MNKNTTTALEKILGEIDSSQKDLKEIFAKRTKGIKKIDITKIHDVLDDFSIHLAFDFETAKSYFSEDNVQIPSNIDKKNLNYEDFIIVLKNWLKNVAFLDESENEMNAEKKEGQIFENSSLNPNYLRSKKRWNDLLDIYSEKLNAQFLNYIGDFNPITNESEHIVNTAENVQDSYKIKEIKVPVLKAEDKISVQDLHMVLRGLFYDDSGYVLVEKPDAIEDFFAAVNSYKTFLKCIEKYYKEFKKRNEPGFNYKQERVSMAEAMEIFDFFLRNEPTVTILEENEFNMNIKKHEEEAQQDDQKNLIRETMIETIVKYQKMLDKCKTEEEKKILNNMINTIKQQLNTLRTTETTVNTVGSVGIQEEVKDIVKEISPIPSKKVIKTVDKTRLQESGLRDIFTFIAKQGHVVGKNATFERVQHESQILSLGEYYFFCKTFNLYNENFNKARATLLFKKTGESHKEVNYDDFKELLAKTANEIYKSEERMTNEAKMDAICLKLGIDAQKSYKEKLHNTHLAFSSIDKEMFRFLPESITRTRVKPLVGKSVDDIRDDIKKRKEQRENHLKERAEEKSRIQSFKKNYEKLQNNKSISAINRSKEDNYSQLQVKSSINKFDLKNKITWDKLENISYSDLKALNDDNFKPTDLFDDNYDEEDQYYLAEYNLTNDKAQKEKQTLELKKNIEEYGKIKQNVRPTQKYQLENSKILNNNDSVNSQMSKQPLKNNKAANISSQILDRANQIDAESKKKEKQLLKNIDEIQSNQLRKGMKAVNKKKNISVN